MRPIDALEGRGLLIDRLKEDTGSAWILLIWICAITWAR